MPTAEAERVLTGSHYLDGDHACTEGALSAGCDFVAGYPITPSTEVAERLAQRLPHVGGKFVQMEDELGSIVAIIGASKNETKRGYQAIRTLLDEKYEGKIYPVNPKGGEIHRETIYPDVADIPDKLDLAVIAARAEFVPAILLSCAKAKVGGATIISGGFAEVGRADLQQRLADIAG